MARQPVSPRPADSDDGGAASRERPQTVGGGSPEVLSHKPLEEEPEDANTMTAAAAAAIKPTVEKGPAKGLEENATKPVPKKLLYRVLADKNVTSAGQRALLREGKELDPGQYNIADLRRQGVRLQAFDPETGSDVQG